MFCIYHRMAKLNSFNLWIKFIRLWEEEFLKIFFFNIYRWKESKYLSNMPDSATIKIPDF